MNFIKENWKKLILISYVFFTPVTLIYAQCNNGCTGADGKICNPICQNDFVSFLNAILTGAIKIGVPIVALAIIYCGFLFVSARGNTEKLSHAKEALLYTLIGAAVLLGAMAIATIISGTVTALGT